MLSRWGQNRWGLGRIMFERLELQHCSPTVPLHQKVSPPVDCRHPWPSILEEVSVLGSERGKRRSSYEMNPLSYEITPAWVLFISVLGSPSSKISPALLSDHIPSQIVNAQKSVVRLHTLFTSYMSPKFSLHQSLLLNHQQMPTVNKGVTGFSVSDWAHWWSQKLPLEREALLLLLSSPLPPGQFTAGLRCK